VNWSFFDFVVALILLSGFFFSAPLDVQKGQDALAAPDGNGGHRRFVYFDLG